MSGSLFLAWKYITYHKFKTLILIACIFLTLFLPVAIRVLLNQFESQILARAGSTPTVIGAKGSDLDLTLSALYFKQNESGTVAYSQTELINKRGVAIPLYTRFTARKFPVVGTTLDYYNFRGLNLARGRMLTRLGDCMVGWQIARTLGLEPGDILLSDREAVLDIGGMTPLKMKVKGIFAPTNTPDDRAVFVDLKTSWVIAGLGHGHQDLESESDPVKVMSREDGEIVAGPAVTSYLEITEENIDSFHFHGDRKDFPVSAIIAVTADEKSDTLLQGDFDGDAATAQFVQPVSVIRDLMNLVFKVKAVFDANALLIGLATAMLLFLVILLSLKLRQREMQTMSKIGASRNTNLLLQLGELGFIFLFSGLLVVAAVWILNQYSGDFMQRILLG